MAAIRRPARATMARRGRNAERDFHGKRLSTMGGGCTPYVAQNDTNRRSAIDGRTTRHPGYRLSQMVRKCIERSAG
jgi:hypothetical protein